MGGRSDSYISVVDNASGPRATFGLESDAQETGTCGPKGTHLVH